MLPILQVKLTLTYIFIANILAENTKQFLDFYYSEVGFCFILLFFH